jgi:hypothetical protein
LTSPELDKPVPDPEIDKYRIAKSFHASRNSLKTSCFHVYFLEFLEGTLLRANQKSSLCSLPPCPSSIPSPLPPLHFLFSSSSLAASTLSDHIQGKTLDEFAEECDKTYGKPKNAQKEAFLDRVKKIKEIDDWK